MGNAPCKERGRPINRVAGIWHEDDIMGINKSEWNVGDSLFRTNEGQHLVCRIEINPKTSSVPLRDGLPELWHSPI